MTDFESYPAPQPRPTVEAPGTTAGFVLGICGIVFAGAPIVGLILAWIGLVKSKRAKRLVDQYPGAYANAGLVQAGYVCSIIGLCLSALGSFCMCAYFGFIILAIIGGAAGAAGGGGAGGLNLINLLVPW